MRLDYISENHKDIQLKYIWHSHAQVDVLDTHRTNMRVMLSFNFNMCYPVQHHEEKMKSLFP